MKPQDLLFIIALIFLLWRRNPQYLVVAGLFCLFVSMPLFQLWIFFTAERLAWYAAGFLLLAVILQIIRFKQKS